MAVDNFPSQIVALTLVITAATIMRWALRKKAWVPVLFAAFPFASTLCAAQSNQATASYTNRLIAEKSPYLLLHAHNPVDWYPWGTEALQKASREHKPIFLSIGYFTCHWCHVMERESFSNPEIAEVLNKYFIAIKVDREERPDIDRLYLAYVETLTTQLGWPLNVFLTPEQTPFFGGTYLAPDKLKALLLKMADAWSKENGKLVDRAGRSARELLEMANRSPSAKDRLNPSVLDKAFEEISSTYDRTNGGFGGAPKFPRTVVLEFLLRTYARTGKQQALDMVLTTLRAMARGGVHDHLGGGFHRYATDTQWRIPHFEKTLSDQAQLALIYCDAYQITHDPFFAIVGRDILDFSLGELQLSPAGFASSLDADSGIAPGMGQMQEGAFYTWTKDEIERNLGLQDAAIFEYRYGVRAGGNSPRQSGLEGSNVLYEMHTVEETARQFGQNNAVIADHLNTSLNTLQQVRAQRLRPPADDKVITAWNGMMISALARASRALDDASYLASAEATARFMRSHLYDSESNRLWRSYRADSASVPGFLDDYTGLINGLLELYEADFDIEWLQWAVTLQHTQDELFWDSQKGGYFDAVTGDASLFARTREMYDDADPSPNSVAAMNLLHVAQITGQDAWRDRARRTLNSFSAMLVNNPAAVPAMASALDFDLASKRQVVIAGDLLAADTQALLRIVNMRFLPNKIVLLADDSSGQQQLARWLPFIRSIHTMEGKATAYICDNYTCRLPTSDPRVAGQLLDYKP